MLRRALVPTIALTLAVAAVALFSPLDRLLRADARETLARSVRSELGDFTRLSSDDLHRGNPRLRAATRPLRRTGAEVAILDGTGRVLVATDSDPQASRICKWKIHGRP